MSQSEHAGRVAPSALLPICWLCYLDDVPMCLDDESRCPVHGLVKDRVLGFVQMDARILDKAAIDES